MHSQLFSIRFSVALLALAPIPVFAGAVATPQAQPMRMSKEIRRLAEAELKRVAGPELRKMERSPDSRWFLGELLKSDERMADLMLSGPLEDPAKSLRILADLWKEDPGGLADRHEQTTAAAVALTFAMANWPEDKAFQRYKYFRDSRLVGKLHPQFDTLETWEKRFVVSAGSNGGWSGDDGWGDRSLEWLRDNVKLPASAYIGACWQAPYKLNNLFGDSIHGADYYAPFQEIHAERVRDVGGVCGSLSHYGANAARANGLPALTMGEPGHCAYAVRVERGNWTPAYSLSWQRGLHTSLWGKTWSQLILQERVMEDRQAHMECMVRAWQARAAKEKDPQAAERMYAAALEAQPLNYPVWVESLDLMKQTGKAADRSWEITGRAVSRSLADYPEVAWALLSQIEEPAMKAIPADRREAFFLNFHEAIAKKDGPAMWDFDKALDAQAKALGTDRAGELAFFGKVLAIQSASKSWFAPVIAWGQKRFGEGDSAKFFAILGKTFEATGGNEDGVKAALGPAILAAEDAGNQDAFQSLGKAGAKFRSGKRGRAEPFPGDLLSSGGLLKISSTSQYDHPIEHWGVLEEDGGSFHTAKQVRPNAVVRLGRLGDLSGIVIAGTDYGQNGSRQMPLKVSVSEDGMAWTEVFRTTEQKGPWRIPLTGKAARVQYVKAERDDDRDEFFHLAAIRVYGRKLQ